MMGASARAEVAQDSPTTPPRNLPTPPIKNHSPKAPDKTLPLAVPPERLREEVEEVTPNVLFCDGEIRYRDGSKEEISPALVPPLANNISLGEVRSALPGGKMGTDSIASVIKWKNHRWEIRLDQQSKEHEVLASLEKSFPENEPFTVTLEGKNKIAAQELKCKMMPRSEAQVAAIDHLIRRAREGREGKVNLSPEAWLFFISQASREIEQLEDSKIKAAKQTEFKKELTEALKVSRPFIDRLAAEVYLSGEEKSIDAYKDIRDLEGSVQELGQILKSRQANPKADVGFWNQKRIEYMNQGLSDVVNEAAKSPFARAFSLRTDALLKQLKAFEPLKKLLPEGSKPGEPESV